MEGTSFEYPAAWREETVEDFRPESCAGNYWAVRFYPDDPGVIWATNCPLVGSNVPESEREVRRLALSGVGEPTSALAVRELEPAEMDGLQGIRAEGTPPPYIAKDSGLSGDLEFLLFSAVDLEQPALFQIRCYVPAAGSDTMLAACERMALSFVEGT